MISLLGQDLCSFPEYADANKFAGLHGRYPYLIDLYFVQGESEEEQRELLDGLHREVKSLRDLADEGSEIHRLLSEMERRIDIVDRKEKLRKEELPLLMKVGQEEEIRKLERELGL